MPEAQETPQSSTPVTIETVVHLPVVNREESQEISSRPVTPMSTETVIHHTPQAPKKPKARVLEFLKPTVYKPDDEAEDIESPCAPKRIIDALSLAGLRKNSKPKAMKPEKKTYPPPRKLTVDIVDGKTDAVIHQYVSVYRLMDRSSKAKEILESRPRAGRYKIYGKYNSAAISSVLNAITHLQPIPLSAEILVENLLTYEACLRLGISTKRAELKPLLTTICSQISNGPIDNEILTFVTYRLGSHDPVFKHTANVLCHQRFIKSVPDVAEFEKMVARKPALQKAMVQIDQEHKARREALKAGAKMYHGSDADVEVSGKSGGEDSRVVEGEIVGNMLEMIAREREYDHKQRGKLLGLFQDDGVLRGAKDKTGEVKEKFKT